MEITFIPESKFTIAEARSWRTYESNLIHTSLVRKHLARILKGWVESDKIANPLAIPWIRTLATGAMSGTERHLTTFRDDMGDDNLGALIPDLLKPGEPLVQTIRRISSLWGEIVAFRELRKLGRQLPEKITALGDWKVGGQVVSVKTLLDLDSNYHVVGSAFEGLAWCSDFPLIGRARELRVFGGTHLDNRFMPRVVEFLHKKLEPLLVVHVVESQIQQEIDCDGLHVESVGAGRDISVVLSSTDSDAPMSELRLRLRLRIDGDDRRDLTISSDHDAWSAADRIDFDCLESRLRAKLDALAKQVEKVGSSALLGWVNVTTHPSHQEEVAQWPSRTETRIREVVNEADFPAVVCFYGGFELATPFLISNCDLQELLHSEALD